MTEFNAMMAPMIVEETYQNHYVQAVKLAEKCIAYSYAVDTVRTIACPRRY